MTSFQMSRQTHITSWAMEKVVSSSNSANSASITMKLIFVFVVKKFAFETKIFSKHRPARFARRVHRLTRSAHGANDLKILIMLSLNIFLCYLGMLIYKNNIVIKYVFKYIIYERLYTI